MLSMMRSREQQFSEMMRDISKLKNTVCGKKYVSLNMFVVRYLNVILPFAIWPLLKQDIISNSKVNKKLPLLSTILPFR